MIQGLLLMKGLLLALLYLPINLAFTALAWLLAPVLPLFASEDGWLPSWLWWFQTPDNSIDGDGTFNKPSAHPIITRMPQYWRRVFWLIRNPSYGFNWTVLATKALPNNPYRFFGNLQAKDSVGMYGWCFSWVTGTMYFHLKIYQPTIFGKCLKFRIGWNLANSLMNNAYAGQKIKYCFTCNPFKSP